MATQKEIKKIIAESLKTCYDELGSIKKADLKFVAEEVSLAVYEEFFAGMEEDDDDYDYSIETERY